MADIDRKEIEEVFAGTLRIHISNRDCLKEVGDWAECQDVGAFVWFPKDLWKVVKAKYLGGKK